MTNATDKGSDSTLLALVGSGVRMEAKLRKGKPSAW
jgi:hypothetical protein